MPYHIRLRPDERPGRTHCGNSAKDTQLAVLPVLGRQSPATTAPLGSGWAWAAALSGDPRTSAAKTRTVLASRFMLWTPAMGSADRQTAFSGATVAVGAGLPTNRPRIGGDRSGAEFCCLPRQLRRPGAFAPDLKPRPPGLAVGGAGRSASSLAAGFAEPFVSVSAGA